jgi:D-alanyl-D-alanine dipeptidase
MKPEQILVDVIALSEQRCQHPIRGELKYCTKENFVGRPIDGYALSAQDVCLLIRAAAEQLCVVQNNLNIQGYGLMIYEAYRPARALRDFKNWSQQPPASDYELERKQIHYPHIEKNQMFELGYIAEDSRHCYGEAVDVVLANLKTGNLVDMGTCFDFMDTLSHVDRTADEIGALAFQHRQTLRAAMEKAGFETYPEEFWHFNFGDLADRQIKTPMDIPITINLSGFGL